VSRGATARTSVTAWVQGGLGNQLFQLNAVLNASELAQSPARLSTVSYLRDLKRRFELEPIVATVARSSVIEGLYFGSPYSDGRMRDTTPRMGLRVRHSLDDDLAAGDLLVGFFQDQRSLAWGTARTTQLLAKAPLSKRATELATRVAGSVVAHVRRGDYVTMQSSREAFGELSGRYYRDAFDYLGVAVGDAIFFTDDVEYVSDQFGARLEMILGADDLHSPLETVRVMGSAKDIVIPNSTFSWWAAELVAPQGRVVAPSHWFLDRPADQWPSRGYWHLVEN